MSDGFPNKPKILRGAFVEFGLSLPPLVVVFQFNPLQLTRNRSLTYAAPNPPAPPPTPPQMSGTTAPPAQALAAATQQRTLRQFHAQFGNLLDLQKQQVVTVGEETIGFDIRLDATDKLDAQDTIAEQFGISPKLATLELMVYPKGESLLGQAVQRALGQAQGLRLHQGREPAAGAVHLRP